MAVRLDNDVRNDILLLGLPNFGAGTLKLYTGTQPALGGGSHSDTLLATFNLNGFDAPSAGVRALTVAAITQPVSAVATGTAGWARMTSTDGTPRDIDFDVTATGGGGDLEINNTGIATNDDVSITSLTLTMPGG